MKTVWNIEEDTKQNTTIKIEAGTKEIKTRLVKKIFLSTSVSKLKYLEITTQFSPILVQEYKIKKVIITMDRMP